MSQLFILALGAIFTMPDQKKEGLPTPDDLVAGYKANYSQFYNMHILWSRRHEWTEISRELEENSIHRMEGRTNDPRLSAAERTRALAEIRDLKSSRELAGHLGPRISFQEYITDRNRYQMRFFSCDSESDLPRGFSFAPPLKADPKHLTEVFSKTRIVASQSDQHTYRVWSGMKSNGRFHAEIRDRVPVAQDYDFPPLGVDHRRWGGKPHEIDAFFELSSAEMRVLKHEVIDGRTTYAVEFIKERDVTESYVKRGLVDPNKGKLVDKTLALAYIDPTVGCLPVRIKWGGGLYYNGEKLGSEDVRYHTIIDVTKLQEVKGAGWYPAEGRIQYYTMDPKLMRHREESAPKSEERTIASLKKLQNSRPHYVLESVATWRTLQISVEETKELLSLEFPIGTEYYDALTKKGMIKGDPQDFLDTTFSSDQLVTVDNPPRHRNRIGWLIGLNLIAAALCIFLVGRKKFFKKTAD